jgi:cysteine desulfurase/selenocysteine lyase
MNPAAEALGYDVQKVRAQFPILRQEVNGKPLIYLDNASTTQKPNAVLEGMDRFYRESYSNIHRGVHTLSVRATDAYEAARSKVARFINASSPSEVIFTRGTTESINLVAGALARRELKAGDEIVLTEMEHHSNIVPWQMLCSEIGCTIKVAPITDDGEIDLERFESMINERTKMVAVIHVSNVIGTVSPVRRMAQMAKAAGAWVLIDGAQSVSHQPVDVQDLGCDFFAFSGHKLYGPTGVGVLYGRAEILDRMQPYQGGGDMILSVDFDKTTYAEPPHRFEAGTPNIAGSIGLGLAIDFVNEIGFSAIQDHETMLTSYATETLGQISKLRIIGASSERRGVASFVIEGIHPHDVGTILDQKGIAIRAGHHCAQPLMSRLGVPATARASFALYNTRSEIDSLAEGILEAIEVFA